MRRGKEEGEKGRGRRGEKEGKERKGEDRRDIGEGERKKEKRIMRKGKGDFYPCCLISWVCNGLGSHKNYTI